MASALCLPASGRDGPPAHGTEAACFALHGLVFAALAWHGWERGIPGSLFNLGHYAAMPVWHTVGPAGFAGLLCLFAGLLLGVMPLSLRRAPFPSAPALRYTAFICLVVLWFLPWNLSLLFPLRGFAAFIPDALFFWLKVILLARLTGMLGNRTRNISILPWAAWLLYGVGLACMAFELRLSLLA